MLKLLRKIRPRTRVGAGIVLVLLVGAGVYWFGMRDASTASTVPTATTRAVAASLTTLEKSVSASGTLSPTVQEDVSFEASGTVTAVPVAAGQVVTAGQTLATIDTLTLNADLLSAKATLASAKAKLSDSEDADDGTDAAEAQIAANAAQVDVAQAGVDAAAAAMADATLTAPVAGLLTEVNLTLGAAVTGSGSTSGSPGADQGTSASTGATTTASAQFVIVGTDSWEVDVTVDDADVALIKVADQAEITLDGADAAIFGTVREIGLISTSSAGVAGYPVVIAVTGSPEGLYDGVAADVVIVYERRTDVLTVPSGAVRTVDGTSTVTQTGDDGKETTTVVTVGDTVGQLTEIVSGLAEGDEVLVTVVQSTTQQDTTERGGTDELPSGFPTGFPEGGFPGGGQAPGGQTNG